MRMKILSFRFRLFSILAETISLRALRSIVSQAGMVFLQITAQSLTLFYRYHRRYQRVPTIDECYTDDAVCRFEANEQFKRDRQVDRAILNILQNRFWNCCSHQMNKEYAAADPRSPCYKIKVTQTSL